MYSFSDTFYRCVAEMEYFWLGRIPCRTVELVGVLVGIQAFEQRIIYTRKLRLFSTSVRGRHDYPPL